MNWVAFAAVTLGVPAYLLTLYWGCRFSDWLVDRFGIWAFVAIIALAAGAFAGLVA